MQNNKTVLSVIAALVIGLLAGYLFWGGSASKVTPNQGGHMMPDGTMMSDEGMSMSSMMMDMNAALRGKTGDAFDQAFLSEMIVHHQGAIDMAELAMANAKHQEIKDLSKAIVSAQTNEIAQMEAWQNRWYGAKQ